MNHCRTGFVVCLALCTLCLSSFALPRFELGDTSVIQGQAAALDLRVSGGDEPYAGMNATIVLPAGVSLLQAIPGEGLLGGSFTVYGRSISEGNANKAAVVAYSTSGSFTNGTLLRLSVQAASNAPVGNSLSVSFAASNPNPLVITRYAGSNADGTRSVSMAVPVSGTISVLAAAQHTLSASPLAVDVSPAAGSCSFDVLTSDAWTAASDQAWASVLAAEGAGAGAVEVEYGENMGSYPRRATITLTGTGTTPGSVQVVITQQASNVLSAAPAAWDISAAARSVSFNVLTTGAWTAVSDQSWASVQNAAAGSVIVSCAANNTLAQRIALITVYGVGTLPDSVPVMIIQAAKNALAVTPEIRTVSPIKGRAEFSIQTTEPWTALSDQTWAVLSQSAGTGSAALSVNYDALIGTAPRMATITVTGTGTQPASVAVTLTQRAGNGLSATPPSRQAGRQAGSTTFNIQAPADWTVASNQLWATASPLSGTANGTLTIDYPANVGIGLRTATITVRDSESSESVDVTLIQKTTDCTELSAPTGVLVQAASGGDLQVTWEPVAGAVSYAVYRHEGVGTFEEAEFIGTADEPPFNDAMKKASSDDAASATLLEQAGTFFGCRRELLKGDSGCRAESLGYKAGTGCAGNPKVYYYWITAVNACEEEGLPSAPGSNETAGKDSQAEASVSFSGTGGDIATIGLLAILLSVIRRKKGRLSRRRGLSGFTCLLLVLCLALAFVPRGWADSSVPVLGGIRPLTPEEEAWRQKSVPRIVRRTQKAALPAAHRNTDFLPKPGQQFLGTCSTWSVCYYTKTYQEAREHNWLHPDPAAAPEHIMGTIFNYLLNNGGSNDGSNPLAVARSILDFGVPPLSVAGEGDIEYSAWPTEDMFRAAMPYRGQGVNEIVINTDAGLLALKEVLAGGDLAVVTIPKVYANLYSGGYPQDGPGVNNGVYFADAGRPLLGHTLAIIGYDDNKTYDDGSGVPKKGAFLAANSWGSSFGVSVPEVGTAGFMWLSYDYVKTQCESTAIALADRIGYQPQLWAIVGIRHPARAELSLRVRGGDFAAPRWEANCFRGTGLRFIEGRIAYDLTDYATDINGGFWLTVFDGLISSMDVPASTGEITYFAVQHGTDLPIVSSETPMNTEDMTYKYLYTGILRLDESVAFEGAGAAQSAAAWADYNLDGWPDVVIAGYGPSGVSSVLFTSNAGIGFRDSGTALPGLDYSGVAWGDYDNDGRPDLALCGYTGEEAITKLYRNTSGQGLVDSGVSLPGATCGSLESGASMLAWGDYDNDGDLDLALASIDPEKYARIYRNDGKNGFVDSGIALPQQRTLGAAWADYDRDGWLDLLLWGDMGGSPLLHNDGGTFSVAATLGAAWKGAAAWGDYDGDGSPDLALTGYVAGTPVPVAQAHIYHNNGGILQDMGAPGIAPVVAASLAWGDYDNDGFLDLAVSGIYPTAINLGSAKHTRMYRNLGDGTFQDLGINGPGVSDGSLAFVDVDGDGDLDLFAVGVGVTPDHEKEIHIWRSAVADTPGLLRPNTRPSPPSSFSAETGATPGAVTLKWNAGTDAQTPPAALAYDVWLSDPAGRAFACISNSPGRLEYPFANVDSGIRTLSLNGLYGGAYQVQLRSTDGGLMASDWSPSYSFVGSGPILGDVNGDGKIDVSDLVLCQRMAKGLTPASVTMADLDRNGVVTDADVIILRDMLVPAAPNDKGYRPIASANIGPAGGTLSTADFELRVPAGAFASSTALQLLDSSTDKPFGEDGGAVTYSIEGIPGNYNALLYIRVKPDPAHAAADMVAIGTEGFVRGPGKVQMHHSPMDAQRDAAGFLCVQLPAPPASEGKAGAETKGEKTTFTLGPITVTYVGNWAAIRTAHFRIAYKAHGANPISWQDAETIAEYFEGEYQRFLAAPFSMSYAGWETTQYRINVTIQNMDPSMSGSMGCSYYGDNYNYIDVNQLHIADDEQMRATAAHEFFHCVESLYDPRPSFDKARFSGPNLWLDEAASTWVEQFATRPNWVPDQFLNGNRTQPFIGMEMAADPTGKNAQEHGYGMSVVLKYLLNSGATNVRTVYERVWQSYGPTPALLDSAPAVEDMSWFNTFWRSFLQGNVYAADIYSAVYSTEKRFRMVSEQDVRAVYTGQIQGIGADLYSVDLTFRRQPFTADHEFAFQLEGSQELSLLVFRVRRQINAPTVVEFLEEAVPAADTNSATVTIKNLAALRTDKWWLAALITNKRKVPPYRGVTPFTLTSLLVQTGYTIPQREIPTQPLGGWSQWDKPAFPVLKTGGQLTGPGLMDVSEEVISDVSQFVTAQTLGPFPASFTLHFNCTPAELSKIVTKETGYELWTASPIKRYEFNYNYDSGLHDYKTKVTSTTGDFPFSVNSTLRDITGPIYACFDFRIDNCDQQGNVIGQVLQMEVKWPAFYLSLTEAGYTIPQPPWAKAASLPQE